MTLNDALWCHMKLQKSFENRDAKLCILMLFKTTFWNCRETLVRFNIVQTSLYVQHFSHSNYKCIHTKLIQ